MAIANTYACCRCNVSIDTQPGFIASLWRSKKSRKHDELQGTLSQGDQGAGQHPWQVRAPSRHRCSMTCGTMTSAAVSIVHGMWNLRFPRELQLLDASPGHASYHVVQIYTTGWLRSLFTVCSWLTSVEWAKWKAGKKVWDASKSEVHSPAAFQVTPAIRLSLSGGPQSPAGAAHDTSLIPCLV